MTGKIKTICIICNRERFVSRSMIYFIKIGKNPGKCKSCTLVGNKRKLNIIPLQETRRKMSLAKMGNKFRLGFPAWSKGLKVPQISGENHYRWIKDRAQLKDDHRDRGGQLHREWSKTIKNRDNWKCKIDNSDCFGKLISHHILGWANYQELRYEINNGITLCQAHHPLKRAEEKRLVPTFQELVSVSN